MLGGKRILKVFLFPYAQCSSTNIYRYAYIPLGLDSHLSAPQNTFEKIIQKLQIKGSEAVKECQQSNPGTIKRKIYEIYQYSLSLLDPHELFLSDISGAFVSSEIEFIYPNCTRVELVQEDVQEMLKKFKARNLILLVGYSCLIPITSLATILPGPNIFLAGNAMRIYYLWTARKSLNRFFTTSVTDKDNDTTTSYPIQYVTFVPSPITWLWKSNLTEGNSKWLLIDQNVKNQIITELIHHYKTEAHDSERLIEKYIKYDKDVVVVNKAV